MSQIMFWTYHLIMYYYIMILISRFSIVLSIPTVVTILLSK